MSPKKLFTAPVSNENAYSHFEQTVLNKVSKTDSEAVWGVSDGQNPQWRKVNRGDYLLFYPGDFIFTYAAEVSGKAEDKELGEQLWNKYEGDTGKRTGGSLGPWRNILFLKEPFKIEVDSVKVQEFAGYSRDYPQNFQAINEKGHAEIRKNYGSIDAFIDDIRT